MIRSLTIDKHTIKSSEEMSSLMVNIHIQLLDLSALYPGFEAWYSEKVVPGILGGERSLLIEMRNDNLAGIAITKNDGLEKKLCCLRVLPEYENTTGIGVRLFERSMEELSTRQPLLSVSNDRVHDFEKIFLYFGFKKSWEYPDLYRPKKVELSYNGLIIQPPQYGNKLMSSLSIATS